MVIQDDIQHVKAGTRVVVMVEGTLEASLDEYPKTPAVYLRTSERTSVRLVGLGPGAIYKVIT